MVCGVSMDRIFWPPKFEKKPNLRPQVPPPALGDVALPDESKSVLEIAEEPEKHLGIWGWVNPIH